MKTVLVAFLVFALAVPTEACAWVIGTTKDARRVHATPGLTSRLEKRLRESANTDLRTEGARMEQQLRGSVSFEDRNDYAVALMYLGRSDQAVELLKKLEDEKPGRYEIAANLGTAYELAGKIPEALEWIREGMHRNSYSHEGTEWLHIKILEAKFRHQQEPDYFKKRAVLNLDFSQLKDHPRGQTIVMDGQNWPVSFLTSAIDYQLQERLKFVKGKDPSVASLLFDYAELEAATGTLEAALEILHLAAQYGYPMERITPLLSKYAWTIRFAWVRPYLFIGVILILAALIFFKWRRRRIA
jgi:tetratricopeptide (TPR) repeat protein